MTAPEAEDIVRRALAILDEEMRAWPPSATPATPATPADETPAPGTGVPSRGADGR